MTIRFNLIALAAALCASLFFIGNGITFLLHDGGSGPYAPVSWLELAAGVLGVWHLLAWTVAIIRGSVHIRESNQ